MNAVIENSKGQRIARITSGAYVLLCCLLLFTLKCETKEEMASMGVIVNLGTTETGSNPDNVPTAENNEVVEEVVTPQEVVQEESEASNELESITQDVVEAEVVASENPTNSNNNSTNTQPVAEVTPEVVETPTPTVNENALFNGNNNANQGNTNGPGDQGNPEGNLESNIYGDIAGNGLGSDGKGWGLNGRGLVSKPQPTNPTNEFGNVTVKITVDKFGKVVKAEFTSFNSTTTNSALVQLSISEAYKVEFNNVATDGKARDKQVGYVVFQYRAN